MSTFFTCRKSVIRLLESQSVVRNTEIMKIAEGDGKIFSLIKRDLINKRIAEEWGLDGLTFCKPELRRGVEYDIFISYTHGDYDVRKNRIDSLIENILMVRLGEKKVPMSSLTRK